MKILRWVVFVPIGLLGGAFVSGLVLRLGDLVLGRWKLTSGIVIYFSAVLLVAISVGSGLRIAPVKSRVAKWLLLVPHWTVAVLFGLPALLVAIFSPDSLPSVAANEGWSRSLSERWQLLVWFFGYFGSLAYASSQDADELVGEGLASSREAKSFQRLYGRALGAADPAERVAAAEQALAQIDTLESWPFPASTLTERVARGKLLGSKAMAYVDLQHLDPVDYSDRSIAIHQEACRYLHEEDGEDWAILMMNFSIAWAERPTGDHGSNLERAIECLQAALSKLDRTRHRETWRRAHGNLAGFLADRGLGDPAENLEHALAAQQEMLNCISPQSEPQMWAMARAMLGSLYLRRIRGERPDNVDKAVSLLEESLKATPRSEAPLEWAHTAVNLASALGDEIRGYDPAGRERAFELLERAIEVYQVHGQWERWASAQNNLGSLWVSGSADSRVQAAENAIDCFEKALTVFTPETHPHDHAMVSTNLSTALRSRRTPDRHESFGASIASAREAARQLNRETAPVDWARAQSVLAQSLLDTRGDGRSAAIEEAIDCLRDALSVLSSDTTPKPWSWAMGNLANAYAARLVGKRAENIEVAIRLQKEALDSLDPKSDPDGWVGANHNLAVSYSERLMGSSADNTEMVIALIERALVLKPAFRHAEDRSELLELLGTAFLDRVRGDQKENVDQAVRALQWAQQLRRREDGEPEWLRLDQKMLQARIRASNLGYDEDEGERPKPAEPGEFLADLQAKAESISPQEHLPTWVNGQIALGDTYTRIPPKASEELADFVTGVRSNIRQAIEIYRGALGDLSRDTEPGLWAVVQRRIATAYQLLHLFEDRRWEQRSVEPGAFADGSPAEQEAPDSLEACAVALADALETDPFDPRQVLEDSIRLGRLHVERGRWEEASSAFSTAANAAEVLLADVELNEQELRKTLRQMADLASLAPLVFVSTGDVDQALQAAESAKARLLAKALTLEALELPDGDRSRLEILHEEIKRHEAKLTSPLLIDRMPPLEAVMECRSELNRFIGRQAGPRAAELIKRIVADGSVLVFPFLTDVGSAMVIVFAESGRPRAETLRFGEDLTVVEKYRSTEDGAEGWRSNYFTYQQGRSHLSLPAWNRTLYSVGEALRGAFADPLAELLERCGIKPEARLHVLAQGTLGNLPLAVAATSVAGETLVDRFEISLSPSLRILAASKERRQGETDQKSLALFTYDDDLPFTNFEAEMIRSRFASVGIDQQAGSDTTKAEVIRMLERRTVWHFAAHGRFEASQPGLSGIELSGGERLTVDDLLELRRHARPSLVALSACMTGLYDQEDLPNEFIGLPAAFLQAGASGVIGTLWPVHDDATALLLSRFYEHAFEEGERHPAALRRAQRWLRDSNADELIRTVRRWSDERRLSPKNAGRMIEQIGRRDRDWMRPAGPPYSGPSFWSGFVYYGA